MSASLVHKSTYKLLNDALPKLQNIIPEEWTLLTLKYFRKAKNYMFGYLEGHKAGCDIYLELD